jgi:hypothetical protein
MRLYKLLEKQLGGERSNRRAGALAVLLAGGLLLCPLALSTGQATPPTATGIALGAFAPQPMNLHASPLLGQAVVNTRPLYPYSIVPGGVADARELRQAIANDPVVAAHYSKFDLANVRAIRLTGVRFVYVSYRIGDRVYWTRRKLRLADGESLLSDGVNLARTRCGNRISETPLGPVRAADPPSEALEQPADSPLVAESLPPFELPMDAPPATDIESIEHHGKIFIPPIIPIWLGGPSSGPGIAINPPPNPPPTPTPVPEPGVLLMLTSGIGALWLFRRRKQ